MRALLLIALISVSMAGNSFAARALPRSIKDVPGSVRALRRIVSPQFYRSLEISPINGWITVRGLLSGDRLIGARIVRSDFNGRYDSLALELANNLRILTARREGTQIPTRPVLLHVLVYYMPDGNLAISFAEFDEFGGTQMSYSAPRGWQWRKATTTG